MSVNMINVEDIVRTQGNKIVTNIKNSSGTIIWPYGKEYDLAVVTMPYNIATGNCHIEYRNHNVGVFCTVNNGDEFTLVATPKDGYIFSRWEINGETISNNPRLIQFADRSTESAYIAYFE